MTIQQPSKLQNSISLQIKQQSKHKDLIQKEKEILEELQKDNKPGFPSVIDSGQVLNLECIVLPLYGNSLMDLMCQRWDRKFSIKTTRILKNLHECGYIHRDIKLDNILLDQKETNKSRNLILIDFGLSTKYTDVNGEHLAKTGEEVFVGNQIFASRRAMLTKSQSRRDDLESMFYMLMFLLYGELPWKLRHSSALDFNSIYEIKSKYTYKELWPNLPKCLKKVAYLIWKLKYKEKPDYEAYERYFSKQIKIISGKVDFIYDWNEDIMRAQSQIALQEAGEHSNKIQFMPEIRQRALSIDIPGTIKDIADGLNIKQSYVPPIEEEENEEESILSRGLDKSDVGIEGLEDCKPTERRDFHKTSTKPSLRMINQYKNQPNEQSSPVQNYDILDIFSFNSRDAGLEEFKESESYQPNFNRYSMSPKDNSTLLQSSPCINRPFSWDCQESLISKFIEPNI
ncbi:UNKNOWN [Stylonychia lemnae]|uniref:Casein kinase I n=1 Tax=Stylonychia lemnae TaxID=5949 RepID=A0A077ZTC1_STYLE|nr:UNKNOWN [Stylonychia lemnae]|eukprot:CDW72575.1 UNKNOWN [Stylonychia lemnae]